MGQNAGNTNTDGFTPQKTTSMASRTGGTVGAITRGPGKNKPRVHLVSSKGKIPAEIVAHALAVKQTGQGAKQNAMANSDATNKGNYTRMPTSNALPGPDGDPKLASYGEGKGNGMVGSPNGGPVNLYKEQLRNPKGVAKRPNPKHQNNPALAGRFTPQGLRYAHRLGSQTGSNDQTNPNMKSKGKTR